MDKNIEIEYKLLISKEKYEEIKVHLHGSSYEQTNFYFDTKDEQLRQKRIMLRVRLKDGQYEFTLKRFENNQLDEYNEEITEECFNKLSNQEKVNCQILTLLEEYNITGADLIQIYSLKTTRIDSPYINGTLSLDLSEYLGTTDYELEYEVTSADNAVENFNNFLKKFGLKYTTNCKGKRHRLCDVLYKVSV